MWFMEHVTAKITFGDAVVHLSNMKMKNGQADGWINEPQLLTQYIQICTLG